MQPTNIVARDGLAVLAPGTPVSLRYRAVPRCTYKKTTEPLTTSRIEQHVTATTRSAADRIQVVFTPESGDPDTALIGKDGHIFDFNSTNTALNNQRVSGETEQDQGRELVSRIKSIKPGVVNPHALNEFSFLLPEYFVDRLRVGETVAIVRAEDRSPWGYYQFMGVTNYRGKAAAVLDLQRIEPGHEYLGSIVYGFDLVDLRTSLPLFMVLDAGSHYKFEQIACDS
jgi:hypothetical protein